MQISEISCMILDATLSYNAIREMQDTRKFLTNASEELELLGTRGHSDPSHLRETGFSKSQTRERSVGIILTGAGSSGRNKALKKCIIQIKKLMNCKPLVAAVFALLLALNSQLSTIHAQSTAFT